jgi:hypothetical protein
VRTPAWSESTCQRVNIEAGDRPHDLLTGHA